MSDTIQSDTIDLVEIYRGVYIFQDKVSRAYFARSSQHITSGYLTLMDGWKQCHSKIPSEGRLSDVNSVRDNIDRYFGSLGKPSLEENHDRVAREEHRDDPRGYPTDAEECWTYAKMIREEAKGSKHLDAGKLARLADILTQFADRTQRFF